MTRCSNQHEDSKGRRQEFRNRQMTKTSTLEEHFGQKLKQTSQIFNDFIPDFSHFFIKSPVQSFCVHIILHHYGIDSVS